MARTELFLGDGRRSWSLSRDDTGYRTYKIKFLVHSKIDGVFPGPAEVSNTPGLPVIGSTWLYGGDIDVWVWCHAKADVKPLWNDEPCDWWECEYEFSNKPVSNDRCQDNPIQDPLLEPQHVSGSFVKYVKEAAYDRFGTPLTTSAREQLRGPQVEFDYNRPQIVIEQNVGVLNLPLCASMVDTVNASAIWGVSPRCVKLSDFTWERKVYGSCYYYYTRRFTFDIDFNTFDRDLLDQGTICLRGAWATRADDPLFGDWVLDSQVPKRVGSTTKPSALIRFTDWHGNPSSVILNGHGLPWNPDPAGTGDDTAGSIHVEHYDESDFTLLSIPLVF
jgi:hypothetical protein